MKTLTRFLFVYTIIATGCAKNPSQDPPAKVSIISITPASGPAGTRVVIKGVNFATDPSANTVGFNQVPAKIVSGNADSLLVVAPANGTTGVVTVTRNADIATGPVFTYTDSVNVYVSAPAFGVAYWKNGVETYLEPTLSNIGGAYGIAVADTDLYVTGYTLDDIAPGLRAYLWKNGKKTMLSAPNLSGEARALVVSGNDVYVGGNEDQLPAYWKNGVKYPLPTYDHGYARINALAVSGSDVYAAGFDSGPGNEQRLVYWKNGTEILLGVNGIIDGGATGIAVNGNDLYVCGVDSGQAVYWKNGVRVVLEQSSYTAQPGAFAIAVKGNSVYVLGYVGYQAVYWKDGQKIILPSRGLLAKASAITFYQSDIYIGGSDGDSIVYWKNGVETVLCCRSLWYASGIAVVKAHY